MIKKFDYENEISFKISKQAYYKALSSISEISHLPFLRVVNTFTIIQKWFAEEKLGNDITKRSRIRTQIVDAASVPFYEYTTKYYMKNNRMEINSLLGGDEYNILDKIVYKDIAPDIKLRSILEDTETGITYMSDIHDGDDFVTIEVEFNSAEDRDKFVRPEWSK